MYGDSHALSSDSRPIILFSSNSTPKLEELFMESDSNYTNNSSGLLRYRSAPTSLLSNFAEKSADFSSRICSSDDNKEADNIDNNNMNLFEENDGKYNRFSTIMNSNNNNSQLPPQYPRQMGSFCVDSWSHQEKIGSNLARQNSSPAGLMFSQNGYAGVMRSGVGRNYRMADNGAIGELSDLSSNLNSCGTILPYSLGPLSRISEVEHESCDDHEKVGNDSLFFSSWNNSSHNFAENAFTGGIKRELDDDQKLFQSGNRPYSLSHSHHLSLPKNSADQMASMEKLLQLQDTVPCKIRAKRGCATHPRSIAERVRRTRISERMRKLQELVPNMDKQTNTADMLDLAVDYIKNLQRQYKMLNDNRANCKCAASQKANLNQTH